MRNHYQELVSDDGTGDVPPHQVLVHIPEQASRWSHVDNLDEFFRRIYDYHQRGGFLCMLLGDLFELVQFIFVVVVATMLAACVDYPVLFHDRLPPGHRLNDTKNPYQKISISDTIKPNCGAHLSSSVVLCLIVAAVFWVLRAVRVFFLALKNWQMRNFYLAALGIGTGDLVNLTWHQIQQKLCAIQAEQQLCINKRELTELDIYQRILRWENYLVAMVNKETLPPKINVPLLGETVFFTSGFKLNLEVILFWGPWAPWLSNWHLRPEYKRRDNLPGLSRRLSSMIFWFAVVNFILSPFIFIWQVLHAFCQYAEVVKREPQFFGARRWSLFARYFLRHFNELDHELDARLNRGYRCAMAYLDLFTTPLMVVLAQNIAFIAGGILAVILVLTAFDEDVVQVEHVITIMTGMGLLIAICRAFLPDENLIFCPEFLMNQVLTQVHYMPDSWRYQAHTSRVQREFSTYFEYKVIFLVEEMLSPLVTPFLLMFWLRPQSAKLVEFFHNFTVEVPGLGDVCSFAQMNIKRHGQSKWQPPPTADSADGTPKREHSDAVPDGNQETNNHTGSDNNDSPVPAQHGKVELSLLHFTVTNPGWIPPDDPSNTFLRAFHTHAAQDLGRLNGAMLGPNVIENPLLGSITSLLYPQISPMFGLGAGMSSIHGGRGSRGLRNFGDGGQSGSFFPQSTGGLGGPLGPILTSSPEDSSPARMVGTGIRKHEGPLMDKSLSGIMRSGSMIGSMGQLGSGSMVGESESMTGRPVGGLLASMHKSGLIDSGQYDSILLETGGQANIEMSLNIMYLHEMHRQQLRGKSYGSTASVLGGNSNPAGRQFLAGNGQNNHGVTAQPLMNISTSNLGGPSNYRQSSSNASAPRIRPGLQVGASPTSRTFNQAAAIHPPFNQSSSSTDYQHQPPVQLWSVPEREGGITPLADYSTRENAAVGGVGLPSPTSSLSPLSPLTPAGIPASMSGSRHGPSSYGTTGGSLFDDPLSAPFYNQASIGGGLEDSALLSPLGPLDPDYLPPSASATGETAGQSHYASIADSQQSSGGGGRNELGFGVPQHDPPFNGLQDGPHQHGEMGSDSDEDLPPSVFQS